MPRVGSFVPADLPQAPDFDAILDALRLRRRRDLAFVHAPPLVVAHVPEGMVVGRNVFGPGHSPAMTDNATAICATREVASVLLHDACLIDSCMAVLDRDDRMFASGMENIGGIERLGAIDAHFRCDDAGALHLADDVRARAPRHDLIALPVCGAGFPNYGHFLFDGLPGVFMLRHLLAADPRVRVVGQLLRPWQRDILAALELEQSYLEVTEPVVFDAMLASTMLSMHVSYPTPFIRPMFDFIRFRLGTATGGERKVFLSRAGDTRRLLRNRAAVEAAMAGLGFEIVQPERLSFREQVALMSCCRMVVGETGAALANLGFCAPGAIVLEIQPERFVEGWVRGMCFMFGHRWHVYFASVDSPPCDLAAGEGHQFSYEIDLADLERVVREVEQPMNTSPVTAPPPAFDADPADIRLVTNLEGFGEGPYPQRFDLFAGAMSPPPVRLLVSGSAATAVAPDHYHRRQLPPVALYAMPGHRLGGAGLLLGPDGAPFGREDCLPASLRERLANAAPPTEWLGALLAPDAKVLELATPCVVAFHPEPSYADFLVDVLPRLYLFATLQRLGRRFPVALSHGAPDWMRRIAALYASETQTVWYDPAREVVRAPAFIVPAMMNVDHYLHPAMNLMVDDLLARAGAAATPSAGGARLYLAYRAFQDGRLSRLDNEDELAAILRDLGFRTLQPWRMTLAEQLAAYRDAACIVSEHSAAACNALFAPHGAKVAVIGEAATVLRRICALRSHLLGIIEPDGGFPADAVARYRIEPGRFRAFMAGLLNDAPGDAAAAPQRSASPPQAPAAAAPGTDWLPTGPYLWTLAEAPGARSAVFAESEDRPRRAFIYTTPIDPERAAYAGRFTDPAYRAYRSPRMGCVALTGASVIGATGLICYNNQLVRDTMHSVDDWRAESLVAERDMDRGARFKRPIQLPGRRLDGEAFCAVSGGWRNHAHWLTETLPRLWLFRWLHAQVPDLQLLVPNYGASAVHKRTLELLGIDPARALRLSEAEVITPDTLWSVPVVDLWSVPGLCRIAATELAAKAAESGSAGGAGEERIYIRRVQGARRLANFDAVAPVLADFGFRVVAMEGLTLDDQIRTMQRARYVIGEHGAGVANIMFCHSGARVLELFNPSCPQPAHWVLASLFDLGYGYVVGRHVPTSYRPDPDWNADYAIEPAEMTDAIRALLAYGGG